MGLFAQEAGAEVAPPSRYTGWTKELGTRNLILWFVAIVAVWYVVGRVQDHFLLQRSWAGLSGQADGLTVVGTLDSKDYQHNMYRVVTSNQTSRVELTDYGWNSIFDDKNGPLFDPTIGDVIHSVERVDNLTCYRMLEPYLRAGIAHAMGKSDWAKGVDRNTPITIETGSSKAPVSQTASLGSLLDKYSKSKDGPDEKQSDNSDVGASDNGHSVEHGMPIPADSLIVSSPVVLVGGSFTSADLEEHPATMFDGKTYTVTLNLSDEGRSRFFQWSNSHENENLIFVLKHRVVAAGRIKQRMNVSTWQIGPLHDGDTAKALVDYVNGEHK